MKPVTKEKIIEVLSKITPEIQALIDERAAIPRGTNPRRCLQIFNQLQEQFSFEDTCILVESPTIRQQLEEKSKAKKKATAKKTLGKFKSRRLRIYPDYVIDENGHLVGPAGTELKFRWNCGKPYVRIGGKDRSVYWLLVEAGFEEHPQDKAERRRAAKVPDTSPKALLKNYNDAAEAMAEDPELFGDPDTGELAGGLTTQEEW